MAPEPSHSYLVIPAGHDEDLCTYYNKCYCDCEQCARHGPSELTKEEIDELLRGP